MPTATRTVTINLPKLHERQQEIKSSPARFKVLDCGRRFGKDILCIDSIISVALAGYPVAWYSPTYKQQSPVWQTLKNLLEPITTDKSEQQNSLRLVTGGTIDMWSLDSPDGSRGRKYKRIVINEAAMVPKLQEAWENVIRPTLTDYIGDALFPSTPKGFNYFKTLYDRGNDILNPDWASWCFPTASNPYISSSEIESARLELPESVFSQEYLAAFISDESSVFRGLLEAATLSPQEPIENHQYVIACDWGKQNDYSVFSVMDGTTKQQVYLDRSNRIDYILQVERLAALYERYKPQVIIAETNSMGTAIIEWIQRKRLPVVGWTANQATKQAVIEDLALAFEQREISILKDPTQLAELQAYEATRTMTGLMRYAAPEGQHDDTVLPLALCWQVCKQVKQQAKLMSFRVTN